MGGGRGRLFVISGPSGVGKTSVTRRLLAMRPDVGFSVSCTTRPPRPGEEDGRDYRFVSRHVFDQLVEDGAFLEWAEVFGNRYGTLAGPIFDAVERGQDVILDIDVHGASQVRQKVPDPVLVFIEPPSWTELERRLADRRTEGDAERARRLARARWEMDQAGWFDHRVVNDDVDRAAERLAAILDGDPAGPGRSAPDPDEEPRKESTSP